MHIDKTEAMTWSAIMAMALYLSDMTTDLMGPALCAVDPTCRRLTTDEIALVKPVFGNKLDYNAVRVFERRAYATVIQEFFGKERMAGTAHFNAIHLHNVNNIDRHEHSLTGFNGYPHQTLLVHELTHVAQTQNNIPHGGTEKIYKATLIPGKPFTHYKREQQATIVEAYAAAYRKIGQLSTYFTNRNISADNTRKQLANACQDAEYIATVIRPHFPASPHPACQNLKLHS